MTEPTFTIHNGNCIDAELKLIQAIQRVRELHKPFLRKVSAMWINAGELETLCLACEVQGDSAFYPCRTIQALDGDTE